VISWRLALACVVVLTVCVLLVVGMLNGGFGFLTPARDFVGFLLTGVKP
jgi:hypothetical protein